MILTALIFAHSRLSIKLMPLAAHAKGSDHAGILGRRVGGGGDAAEDEDKEQEDKEESL